MTGNRKVNYLCIIDLMATAVGTQHEGVKGFLDKCLKKEVSCRHSSLTQSKGTH
jgi:hypothetical protein